MKLTIPTLLLAVLAATLPVAAQQGSAVAVTGTVVNAETGEPVPAATISAPSAGRRTFSQSNGAFRIPLPPGEHALTITSIGYRAATQTVRAGSGPVTIRLTPTSISARDVTVTADITPEEIVRRAIARKEENQAKLKTFQGLLYSKFILDIEGNAFGKIEDEDRNMIAETFSRNYYDAEKGPRIEIIQRRQTANLPAAENLFALGNFFSFYEDNLRILNTSILSPLASDPFSRYNYKLLERTMLDSNVVYVIGVTPATRVLPAFEGTIKIVRGTYDLVEVDLAPSRSTAIAFVRNLRFQQKFDRFTGDIWQPTYLKVTGDAEIEIVRGIADVRPKILATSIFTEVKVNDALPDSVYGERKKIISVATDADSARPEFWENNALSELSDEEKQTYQRVDSLVVAADTTGELSGFDFGIYPVGEFNRVGSVMLGAGLAPRIPGPVRLDLQGRYSFGQKRPFGAASLRLALLDERGLRLGISGKVQSAISTMTNDRSIPMLLNSVTAAVAHRDYYDYFREDGWSAGIDATVGELHADARAGESRQFSLDRTTSRSIFESDVFRPNPHIVDGSYRTATAELGWGRREEDIVISSALQLGVSASVSGLYGETTDKSLTFRGASGWLEAIVPTIPTGYAPMVLRVAGFGGITADATPSQYQFRLRTSSSVFGRFGSFLSAPVGVIGGTRYAAFYAEHQFGDILWRALGLPTYEGRGIELSLAAGAAQFYQDAPLGYLPTGNTWYTEVGFGVAKIPTFISNIFYLQFDARWGTGPLGSGKFGATIGLSSPF